MTAKGWLPWVAALATFSAAIALGNWQTRRADEKEALQARIDAARSADARPVASVSDIAAIESELPRRVNVRGEFVEASTVYLGNRIVDGVSGFQVVTPVRIAANVPLVLVDRGWTARDPLSGNPSLAPRGSIVIEGLAVAQLPRLLELGGATEAASRVWANLDFLRFEAVVGAPVARFVVEQSNEFPDGLKRLRSRIDAGADRNRGYAVQWYALAALIVGLTLVYGVRRRRLSANPDAR